MASPATALGTDPPFDAALREAHGRLLAMHCAAIGTLEAELQRMRNENTLLRMQLSTGATEAPLKVEAKTVTPVDRKADTLPEQAITVIPATVAATSVAPAAADARMASTAVPAQLTTLQLSQVVQPEIDRTAVEQPPPVTFVPSGLTSNTAPGGPSPGAHARPVPTAASTRAATAQDELPTGREESMGVADEGAASGASSQRKANVVTVASGPRLSSSAKGAEAAGTATAATPQLVEVRVLKEQELVDGGTATSAPPPAVAALLGPPVAGASNLTVPVTGMTSPTVDATALAVLAVPGVQATNAVMALGSLPATTASTSGSGVAPSATAGRLVQPNHHSDSAGELDMTTPRPPATPKVEVSVSGGVQVYATPPQTAEPEIREDVIEVITPGAMLELADGVVEQDVDRALEAVLAYHGWQHLDVQKVGKDAWSFSGALVHIRCEASPVGSGAAGGPPYNLQASADDGRTWEQLEGLIRHRRLHKVVRTAPIASSLDGKRTTPESPPNQSSNQVPISLADLARMPSRASPVEGHMVLQGRASTSGRSGRSRESSRDRPGSPHGSSGYHPQGAPYGPTSKHPQLLPIGADGLPTHRHDGLPSFNNAFPTYFDALSGPTNYYNSFRIAGARGPDPYG